MAVECILHAGDIHHFSVLDRLQEVAPVYAARGNGEDGSGGREVQPDDDRVKRKLGVGTGWIQDWPDPLMCPCRRVPPHFTVERWKQRLFPEHDLDVLVYGDTHVEQIDLIDNTLCINPGVRPPTRTNLSLQPGTIGFLYLDKDQPGAEIIQLTESGAEPFDWENSRRPW